MSGGGGEGMLEGMWRRPLSTCQGESPGMDPSLHFNVRLPASRQRKNECRISPQAAVLGSAVPGGNTSQRQAPSPHTCSW